MNQRQLKIGRHSLNFEIDLPEYIPATMKFDGFGKSCSIQYKLIAGGDGGQNQKEWPIVVKSSPLPNIVQDPFFMEPQIERAVPARWDSVGMDV
jgi:hypothetical protein